MIIKTLITGPFEVNNYLVIDENTNEAALIDAGGDYQATKKLADANNSKIKYILNTHGHLDHIAGDEELQRNEEAKIFIHKDDEFFVSSLKQHLMLYGFPDYEVPVINEFIRDDQIINIGSLDFKVIHTPGHSPGSVCYLIENHLFSGDTLFQDSVGRTDLPGGSYEVLKESITRKLFGLSDDIIVYPGHGDATSIKHERENNPFFGKKANV